jgi:hypothetical protein
VKATVGLDGFVDEILAVVDKRYDGGAAGRDGRSGPLPEDVSDARSADPSRRMSDAEQAERIARLVSALPPRQREVFLLHACEGLAPAEIAAVLGIEESNTRANLHFARQRLKEWLAPDLADHRRRRERETEARTGHTNPPHRRPTTTSGRSTTDGPEAKAFFEWALSSKELGAYARTARAGLNQM